MINLKKKTGIERRPGTRQGWKKRKKEKNRMKQRRNKK